MRLYLRMSWDSRVQIRPFCPRRPFISLPRVQIMGFRPRRLSCMLSRTAARARSAQGTSQAEFLREGIFRCRAEVGGQGKLCGDGKPAGPDVPLENGFSGINKSSSDDRPGPGICDSKYVEDAKAARSVRVWDRVPMKNIRLGELR